jgi:cytochrome P450
MSQLPDGPRRPRMVQAWFWLKRPIWFLDHCWQRYGDVFTMRLPFGMDLVHVADPELVKAVFGGNHDVLRAGEANALILEPRWSRSSTGTCARTPASARTRFPPGRSWPPTSTCPSGSAGRR